MKIKYEAIDIFSGCGGVSCGLSLAGFKVKSAVEIEKHAVDTYLNYGPLKSVNVLNEDMITQHFIYQWNVFGVKL